MSEQGCRRFVGKVALVTGAGQGIGLATAWRLAREGAQVVLADKSAAPTHEAAEAMRAEGLEVAVAITLCAPA
jgi:dihydroxycyclohexadiene carboxylate dehydrogenase